MSNYVNIKINASIKGQLQRRLCEGSHETSETKGWKEK